MRCHKRACRTILANVMSWVGIGGIGGVMGGVVIDVAVTIYIIAVNRWITIDINYG